MKRHFTNFLIFFQDVYSLKNVSKICVILISVVALVFLSTVKAIAQSAPKTSASIDGVLTSYFKISNDLAEQNFSKSAADAKDLLVGLDGVNLIQNGNNEQKTWLKHADDLKFAAWHINDGASLTEQRNYFSMLSKYLYKVLKENNFYSKAIYKLRNSTDHTFWLGQTGDAANPYAGFTETNNVELAEVLHPVALLKSPE